MINQIKKYQTRTCQVSSRAKLEWLFWKVYCIISSWAKNFPTYREPMLTPGCPRPFSSPLLLLIKSSFSSLFLPHINPLTIWPCVSWWLYQQDVGLLQRRLQTKCLWNAKAQVEEGPVTTSGDMFERANSIAVQMALFVRLLWRQKKESIASDSRTRLPTTVDHSQSVTVSHHWLTVNKAMPLTGFLKAWKC